MTNSKMTKKALLTSIMALMLCFAMLTGTTFAWFTDQETSANNRIVAGNLDVDLLMYKDADGTNPAGYYSIANASGDIFSGAETANNSHKTLWEPGKTQVAYLAIENKGTLDLKYKVELNVKDPENGKLYEVMSYTLTPGAQNGDVDAWDGTNALSVVPGKQYVSGEVNLTNGNTDYFALSIHMSEEAGNDYQGDYLIFDITIYATQLASEADSFDNTYDETSEYEEKLLFNSEADLLQFAPVPGDIASSGLSLTSDGKALVEDRGAWYNVNANFLLYNHTVEYDLDISNLPADGHITLDTGDSETWNSTPIYIERGSAKIYYGTAKNEAIGVLAGTEIHVKHTYKFDVNGNLAIITDISDGTDTVSIEDKAFAIDDPETVLYWDIYDISDSSLVTMDNFVETREPAEVNSIPMLIAVIEASESGAEITMAPGVNTSDNPGTQTITVDKEITLNPNGMYLVSAADATFTVVEGGKLTVTDGSFTIKNTATNGAAVFVDGGEFIMAGGSFDAPIAMKTAAGNSSTVTLASGWSNRVTQGIVSQGNDTINVTGGTLISSKQILTTASGTTTEINISGGTLSGKSPYTYNATFDCKGKTNITMTGGKVESTSGESIAISVYNDSVINISGNAVVSGAFSGVNSGGGSRPQGNNNIINISGNAKVSASGSGNSFGIGYAVYACSTNTSVNVSGNAQITGTSYGVYAGQEGSEINVSDYAIIKATTGRNSGYGIGAPKISVTGGTIEGKEYGLISDMGNSTVVIDNSTTETPIKINGGTYDVYIHSTTNYTLAGNPEFDTFGTRS